MATGVIKNKIWTDIWAGGITNPLAVIEQLTYLMFIHLLDEKELERELLAPTQDDFICDAVTLDLIRGLQTDNYTKVA